MLALQIFLLLLSAYLAGCMVGCILRRALYTPQPALAVPAEVPVEAPVRKALPVEAGRFETALTGKPAAPPAVVPVGEPVVEVRPRPVAVPPVERSLRDNGTADIEIIKTPPRQPEPVQVPEPPVAQVPDPVVEPVAVAPEPAVVREKSVPSSMMGAPQMASYAAVAAAAAAARAAAEAEAAARALEAEPEPEPEPQPEAASDPEADPDPVSEPEVVVLDAEPPEPVSEIADAPVAELAIVPDDAVEPAAPAEQPVADVPVAETPVAEVAAAQAERADDLKRIRGIDQALEDRLTGLGVRRFADIAAWSSDDVQRMNQSLGLVGRIEQENWIEQADILARGSDTNYSRRQRIAATTSAVGMAAAAASAAANATAQMSAGPDRFTRIIGIDPDTEKALYGLGFSRYSEIAQWTSGDVERVEAALGRPGRVGLDNWIEQARVLARYAGETVEARPVRLADAIRENKAAKPAEPAAARTDMAGLRSVRSQALRGEGSALGDRTDDLKRIRGIGVLIEKRLNALGITSYEQVANWTKADIDSVSAQLDFRGRIERENWVEQARILASGGQTEFSRRVDRGEVETSKDS
jgi:predicted flap endonuclease-1-like 5' DNA nuclease